MPDSYRLMVWPHDPATAGRCLEPVAPPDAPTVSVEAFTVAARLRVDGQPPRATWRAGECADLGVLELITDPCPDGWPVAEELIALLRWCRQHLHAWDGCELVPVVDGPVVRTAKEARHAQ